MKKIVCILLAILMVMSLSACGNRGIGPGNYKFSHVHISNGSTGYCAEVKSWREAEIGIELRTAEFGSIYCSEGTYVLFEDGEKCPFCHNDK